MHKECGELPEHMNNHTLHDQHPLTLRKIHNNNISSSCCFYCDKPFGDEYAYSCQECDFYMHMRCASIPLPTLTSHDGDIVRFSCHQHPMPIVHQHEDKGKEKEKLEETLGNSINVDLRPTTPSDEQGENTVQVEQGEDIVQVEQGEDTVQVEQGEDTVQVEQGKDTVQVEQGEDIVRVEHGENTVQVEQGEKIVHVEQGNLRESQAEELEDYHHDHSLVLVENACCDHNIQCDACLRSYKKLQGPSNRANSEVQRTQSLLFRCMECTYNLHFICGPLPFMVKDDYHIHKLTLVDSLNEEEFDEYYCDFCEEERNPQFRMCTHALTANIQRTYNYFRNLNSQFDELGSLENFNKFKEFLQGGYSYFRDELFYYTSEEGLKVEDEKYLRQEVVEVVEGKYMVPNTLAPILTTFIRKYGDLDRQSRLTIGMRSVISTLLCTVIDKMCRTKLEDITMDHLKQWRFYLQGIENISGFNLYPIREVLYEEFLDAHLGYKVIRWEKEVIEKLDAKIAELKKCEKMREELSSILSHKSSTTLERLSAASKWKNKALGDCFF
ncbi:hypothetical protein G4B88_022005 [Cannabis sativa]|uniref:DC1 domain-containing protein n=1 Tax=Cannabis sativa TaxID=3483 RepID=A0A7J6G009_CANSA|nr:hypothetical protein G4B88_022005 [Cannabis sativa]